MPGAGIMQPVPGAGKYATGAKRGKHSTKPLPSAGNCNQTGAKRGNHAIEPLSSVTIGN